MLNVLSLFDGMSCGQLALQKLGIKDYNYYASEIDKYSMAVTMKNFPNTIQIWDITKCEPTEWNFFDLLIWWSPCQWFSFAWKQLNFDDERSKLFFEYVRILKEVKPKYFLLENVKMKKEYQDIISQHLFWVQPIEINSSLLSAQNRKRLYWVWELQSDWTYKQVTISQPEDKGALLKDILEDVVDEKYYLSEKVFEKLRKYESNARLSPLEWKCFCLSTMQWGHRQPKIWYAIWSREFEATGWKEDKSPTLCARDYKDQKVVAMQFWNSKNFWNAWGNEKGYCIKSNTWHWVIWEYFVRKLTPLECQRLQTVPDQYFDWTNTSDTQKYKMLGNWWTIDVISHIFSHLWIKK